MEMHERIKNVRKKNNMSQNEFAERLGVTRSVISNIELNRLAKPEQKASLIKLISKEFNVNEEWLLNGTGEMTIDPDTFSLDEYAKQRGATDFDLEIVKAYFEMPKELREAIKEHFISKTLPQLRAENENAATKEENPNSIDHEVEAYRQELIAEAKGEILSVSEKREGA